MSNELLLYFGAALAIFWGVAHIYPTRNVITGFGNISQDNKNIITMEWIIEGIALIYIGAVVIVATMIDHESAVSISLYLITAGTLIILALISLFTGFKVNFLPFKLCPIIFSISAGLILLGAFL